MSESAVVFESRVSRGLMQILGDNRSVAPSYILFLGGTMALKDDVTRRVNQLDYGAIVHLNRETFLLKHSRDFVRFELFLRDLQAIWLRVSRERDSSGRSHVGLTLLSSLLIRHCVFGFQQLMSYQSFLAWLCLRPGLEGLLIMGKWVDDSQTATIWRERAKNVRAYSANFSGQRLISKSLPQSEKFRDVLTRLNDEFVHPNP